MTILGHNVRASNSVANQVDVVNSGWYSSMIKMYYTEGITFHSSNTSYAAGATFYNASGTTNEIMRITNGGNVGIGTTSPEAKLEVGYTSFSANNRSLYVRNSASSINAYSYDTMVIQQDDVVSLRIVERNVSGTDQVMAISIGDGLARIAVTAQPLQFMVNGSASGISYQGLSGTIAMHIATNGNIGIGTTSPSAKLDVYAGADATSNLVLWGQTIRNEGNGATTGYGAGLKLKLSSDGEPYKWAGIAAVAGTGYSNRTDLGLFTAATSTANATEKVRITGEGNVGIGTTSPSYKLDVSGDIRATADIIAYSDARVKENINTITDALTKVTSLRGVSYTRKDTEDKSEKVGVIAQEVLEVLPQVVQQDTNGNYSVSYGNIVGVLIEAIKELKTEVEDLKYLLSQK